MRPVKKKLIILTVGLCVYLMHRNLKKSFSRTVQVINPSVVLNYVVVHLDLKGAPPKLKYLESLLPKLKHNGVNGLLVEYEDMFPYEGNLINISAKNSYDRNELKQFLAKSIQLGIEIIPLIQTFGHIEHALKLKEFKHLRELPMFPDSLCPSKPESIQLVKNMLEQVIKFHLSIAPLKHVHIGCDEVYLMNKCILCRSKKLSNLELFYNHVHKVDLMVRELSPQTTVLIWDDMFRDQNEFQSTKLDLSNIEPVYWDYKPQLIVTHLNFLNYHKQFKNTWIASAFKGADGRIAILPNITNRFNNNLSWLDFIADYKFAGETDVFNFKGIILTGWSRYSHMDPLCELLPVSIPSLMLNLLLIQTMKKGLVPAGATSLNFSAFYIEYLETEFQKRYKCKKMSYISKTLNMLTCSFETSALYYELHNYKKIKSQIDKTLISDNSGLITNRYYAKKKNINKHALNGNIIWCFDVLKRLSGLEKSIRKYMTPYYEKDVIDEYVGYKMYDIVFFKKTMRFLKSYLLTSTWDRRP